MRAKSRGDGGHMKGTTACLLRLRREIAPAPAGYKRLFVGDSWFASVATAVAIAQPDTPSRDRNSVSNGDHFVGIVKTAHARFPKAYIEKALDGLPRGAKIVLEATVDGVPLVAVGWRYNQKKTLSYICTRGAGSTVNDDNNPYTAKFPDPYGNVTERKVPRPAIVGKYYDYNNVIDRHNHLRQGELHLEKDWQTQDCWFRIFTTLIGMIAVDTAQVVQRTFSTRDARKEAGIVPFVACLGKELLDNEWSDVPVAATATTAAGETNIGDSGYSVLLHLSDVGGGVVGAVLQIHIVHVLAVLNNLGIGGTNRRRAALWRTRTRMW